MSDAISGATPAHDGYVRVRLSEWARQEGISRLTAYRMLKRGILPVPSECSPTGRWYVLLPPKRTGRTVIYTRASPGPDRATVINNQVAALSEWMAERRQPVFTVIREIANPYSGSLPRLERLLADRLITEIVIDNPAVVGDLWFHLLVASLSAQGRKITAMHGGRQSNQTRKADLQTAIVNLCETLHGPDIGLKAAYRAIAYTDED